MCAYKVVMSSRYQTQEENISSQYEGRFITKQIDWTEHFGSKFTLLILFV